MDRRFAIVWLDLAKMSEDMAEVPAATVTKITTSRAICPTSPVSWIAAAAFAATAAAREATTMCVDFDTFRLLASS
jgi:hypothetical protein